MGYSDVKNMSPVNHPTSGKLLRIWFPTWGLGPRLHPIVGCREGSRAIGPPMGDSDASNMSHVPHPPSGRFLCPWFRHLGPGPKMALLMG